MMETLQVSKTLGFDTTVTLLIYRELLLNLLLLSPFQISFIFLFQPVNCSGVQNSSYWLEKGDFSPGGKRSDRIANSTPPYNVNVKKKCNYASCPTYDFVAYAGANLPSPFYLRLHNVSWMTNLDLIWSGRGLIGIFSQHLPEGWDETYEKLQELWWSRRDSKKEYKTWELPLHQSCLPHFYLNPSPKLPVLYLITV